MEQFIKRNDYEEIASSIYYDISHMVFGEKLPDAEENMIHCFTDPDARKKLKNETLVWRDGNFRFPHVNKSTGNVGLYENEKVLKLAFDPNIIKNFTNLYNVSSTDELVYYNGPPAPLVKPKNSGKSAPYMYSFAKNCYTGILTITGDSDDIIGGHIEILQNFLTYYDVLNKYYDFESKINSRNDILFLESKWFSVKEANEVIEEYTALYNYHKRRISCKLGRSIRWKVSEIYQRHSFEVPKTFEKLEWKKLKCCEGDFYIFSDKDVIRTSANNSNIARVYVQFSVQKIPSDWDLCPKKNDLNYSYETGKFGDWAKPGLRRYLRENSTEYSWRHCKTINSTNTSPIKEMTVKQKRLLGI